MNHKIILQAIVGSKAYNLDTEQSDTDIKGIYLAKNEEFLSLKQPKEVYNYTNPDITYYELGKFMKLALKMNPTAIELFWVPKSKYFFEGKMLVENRRLFLSNLGFKTYYGYAISQLKKTYSNGSDISSYRAGKHARHIFRLLLQGKTLLKTGELNVRLSDEEREYIFGFEKMTKDELFNEFEKKAKEFNSIKSVLPDKPDYEAVNKLCIQIRKQYGDY